MTEKNPLLTIELPIPFDRVRPEHVEPAVDFLLQQAQTAIDAIAETPGPRTYQNTLEALDLATEPLDYAMGIVRHLEAVVTSDELRHVLDKVQPKVSAFDSRIQLNPALWSALKEFAATPEAAALDPVRARFLTRKVDSFRRAGADLDPAGKKRLEEMDVELATITTKFGQNVLDSTLQFEYYIEDEPGLAGLPPSAIAAARQSAESKGKPGWRFTLQAPSYIAVMSYLDDAGVRELFYRTFSRRATEPERDNAPLVARILELRREKARLLGYATFADLVLADRMAKKGDVARKFVADLREKTEDAFQRENAALAQFAGRELAAWDTGYFAEKQRKAEYAFEEEDLRPYFPMEQVLKGMFELVRRLYGIVVAPQTGIPVWHPEVIYYEIREEAGGELLGGFYADWFPRETKRGGAWMDAFVTGRREHGTWRPHMGLMCGNMTAPLKDRPSLLTHREAETVFHEFGHLLHHCLSKVDVRGLAGTNVAWDFVELPSQIMENWCWERASLDLFARHWQTGEPIPEELFAKMKRARTFRGANGQMRQLGFASVDLGLHVDYDPARDGEAIPYSRRVLQQFTPATLPDDHAMVAGFTHLFSDPVGYGAGYYSYKWAEVLDADAFSRFREGGIFSREVGMAFRRTILEKGNSEDPATLFRTFMGRDPDPSALMRRLGLAA